MKKIFIDEEKCIKCGRCVALFPDNFDLQDENGIACVKDNNNAIYEMEQVCETKAITVIDEESE